MKFLIICLIFCTVLCRKPKSEFGHWLTHEMIIWKTHYDQFMKRWLAYKSFGYFEPPVNNLFNATPGLRHGYSERLSLMNDMGRGKFASHRFRNDDDGDSNHSERERDRFGHNHYNDSKKLKKQMKSEFKKYWKDRFIEKLQYFRNQSNFNNTDFMMDDRFRMVDPRLNMMNNRFTPSPNFYFHSDYYKEFDWRSEYPVSTVDDELISNCDSSYIFATLNSIEATQTRKNNYVEKLSSQEYLDCNNNNKYKCDKAKNNNKNKIDSVIEYYSGNTVCVYNNYKYTGEINNYDEKKCNLIKKECENKVEISNLTYYISNKESDIESLVHYTPIITKININTLYNYNNGNEIYDNIEECNGDDIGEVDHWVSVVGFGKEDNNREYWIIKNDFGKDWGDKGYLKLAKGKNMCGIGKENYFIYDEYIEEYVLYIVFGVTIIMMLTSICGCWFIYLIFNLLFKSNKDNNSGCFLCRKQEKEFLFNEKLLLSLPILQQQQLLQQQQFYNQSCYYKVPSLPTTTTQQEQLQDDDKTNQLLYSQFNECNFENSLGYKDCYFEPLVSNLPMPLST